MKHVSLSLKFLAIASLSACAADAPSSTSDSATTSLSSTVIESDEAFGRTPAAGQTQIRIVHASAEAPAVDIYAVGSLTPAVRGIKFGETSPYLTLPAGSYAFQVRLAGSPATQLPLYTTAVLRLDAGKKYAAVAAGNPRYLQSATNPMWAPSLFRVLALDESYGQSAAGTARLRVLHGSSDAPTVGIDLGDDNAAAPEVPALPRYSATDSAGVSVPAGTALQVGIVAGGNKVTAFTTPALPSGGNFLAIAVGQLGNVPNAQDFGQLPGLSVLVVGPSGSVGILRQNPLVYALHASADAPAVDIFAGAARVYSGLSYGGLSQGVRLPPGSYNLDIFGAGGAARPAGNAVFNFGTGELKAGERYLAVANGFLSAAAGEEGFNVRALALKPAAGNKDNRGVTFLHALPDAPSASLNAFLPSGGAGSISTGRILFGGSANGFPFLLQSRSTQTRLNLPGQSPMTFVGGLPEFGFAVVTGSANPFNESPPRIITVDTGDRTRGYNAPWVAKSLIATP